MDPLTLGLIGTLGAQALSGGVGAYGQYKANQAQQRGIQRAQGAITNSYGQAQGYQQPYLQAGQEGLKRMMSGDFGVGLPEMPDAYKPEAFNYQEDPGMAYRMQTGQQAINSSAAAAGTGLSGATLKALSKFGQNLGSQEYGNAYDRYSKNRQMGLNEYEANLGRSKDIYSMQAEQANNAYVRARDLGNYGQQASTDLSNLASDYGSNMAGLYGQQGANLANRNIGMAQNVGTTLGNMANTGLDYGVMSQLSPADRATYLSSKKK